MSNLYKYPYYVYSDTSRNGSGIKKQIKMPSPKKESHPAK